MAESITAQEIIKRARDEYGVRSVIVGFSGGKDAIVTLDLCRQSFDRVEAYFLYIVPGLDFQERYLTYCERRFDVKIQRLPSPTISAWMREGGYRMPSASALGSRKIKRLDIENYLRKKLSIEWFATGEKCIDSIERNAMIRKMRGVDPKRRQIWPVAYWNNSAIWNHIKRSRIILPPDYRFSVGEKYMARSFGSMGPTELRFIRENYPADYKKIVDMFPLLPANIARVDNDNKNEIATKNDVVRDGGSPTGS